MDKQSAAHVTWECKYHIVCAPKFRRQIICGQLKTDVGSILRDLCDHKGAAISQNAALAAA